MTVVRTSYYRYWSTSYRIEVDEDHTERGYLLNPDTGVFERNDDLIFEVTSATTTSYISAVPEEQYRWQTEGVREQLTGTGPVFALYDTVDAIYARVKAEGRRRLTDGERVLVQSIRKRTFALWEDDERRRAAGQEPLNVATGWRGQPEPGGGESTT
ncbi:hypothetical protein ACOBQX_28735 [Actinokineospora sp. G85]|uniref:hypothetical protein n=1 Tax=Actinokineospora sp. G85 TaxID=3406626 RepID=UPI003C74A93F